MRLFLLPSTNNTWIGKAFAHTSGAGNFEEEDGVDLPNEIVVQQLGDSGGVLTYKGQQVASSGGSVSLEVKRGRNLFNSAAVVSGQYHDTTNGAIVPGASNYETHPIPVKVGYIYTFNRGDAIGSQYCFFTSGGAFISGGTALLAKAPATAATMIVRVFNSSMISKLMVIEGTMRYLSTTDYQSYNVNSMNPAYVQGLYRSRLYGKTVMVIGDSISTGYGDGEGVSNQYASRPYHYVVANERFIHVQNLAVSGYATSHTMTNVLPVLPPTESAPDVINIMLGTNDHGFNIALGTLADAANSAATTFFGRYKYIIETLQTLYPNVPIGLITPLMRNDVTNGNTANAVGKVLRDYCDAVVAIAKNYGLPYLDWYYTSGFSPYNAAQKASLYVSGDGTHPNNAGHMKLAGQYANFLEGL